MSATPYFLYKSIDDFLELSKDHIIGTLSRAQSRLLASQNATQTDAWEEEIDILRPVLEKYRGRGSVLMEYSIPRMGRRIDVVLLIDGVVFILEFKIQSEEYNKGDIAQLWEYAIDLHNFHEETHNRVVVPVLVASEARSRTNVLSRFRGGLYYHQIANKDNLSSTIDNILSEVGSNSSLSDDEWALSRYAPTPTIIEAATSLYLNHSVEEISRSDASAQNLTTTTQSITKIIEDSERNGRKSICFVTGVPGAGKTLVGLNVATQQSAKDNVAVYLSGNFPLVAVLTEALARNKIEREASKNNKIKKKEALSEVKSFIQMVHHYRDAGLQGARIQDGQIVMDEHYFNKVENKDKHFTPVDHIAIFDEAQRAWTKEQLVNFMARKKHVSGFPMSEPEFLISCLDRHKDWAVIICLVGGGQEINTGEAGISEWIRALNERFPHWHVYVSNRLHDDEYAAGQALEMLEGHDNVNFDESLHLAVSLRSFRAENLSNFVHSLLNCEADLARNTLQSIKDFNIRLTRDVDEAKRWLKSKAGGRERYGIVASSGGERLKPEDIVVRLKADVVHWFLDDEKDIRSSLFLEDVATEFDVQGLELDFVCVAWDADFRYTPQGWKYFQFSGGTKWNNVKRVERQLYRKNAYRVLLTRARQGMVIFVPKGDVNDQTRLPEFYDGTYEYLRSLGIKTIGED